MTTIPLGSAVVQRTITTLINSEPIVKLYIEIIHELTGEWVTKTSEDIVDFIDEYFVPRTLQHPSNIEEVTWFYQEYPTDVVTYYFIRMQLWINQYLELEFKVLGDELPDRPPISYYVRSRWDLQLYWSRL